MKKILNNILQKEINKIWNETGYDIELFICAVKQGLLTKKHINPKLDIFNKLKTRFIMYLTDKFY